MPAKSSSPKPVRRLAIASSLSIVAVALVAGSAFADRAPPSGNVIRSVDHVAEQASTKVIVRGSSTPTFTIYKLDRPSRVVVDIANATLDASLTDSGESKTTIEANTWAVGQIAAHRLEGTKQQVVRVVVGMARAGTYKVRAVGSNVVITVTAREQPIAISGGAESAELEAARRAEASAQQAAAQARSRAAKAEADAEAARKEASAQAARAAAILREAEAKHSNLDATTAQDKRALTAAREAEGRAREAESRARAQAEEALRSAEVARKDAEEARLQANRERSRAKESEEAARQRAEAAIARARIDAEAAKKKAEDEAREVSLRAAQAEAMMKDASVRLAKAKQIEQAATKAMAQAEKAQSEVEQREAAARDAERRAEQARDDATRASKAADRYKADANAASAGNEDRAAKLAKRAEEAAAAAESRRRAAEEATKLADARRAEAEVAATAANERKSTALAAAKEAEAKRATAEADRRTAEQARATAETARQQAERQRKAMEQAARLAEEGAQRAKALREREEAALTKAAAARKTHEARRQAAEDALAALNESLAAARRAEDKAVAQRQAAHKATAAAAKAEQQRAPANQVAAARAEAERLHRELAEAEAALAKRQTEVSRRERSLSKLDAANGKAQAELATLRAAADKARQAREREEKAVADLVAERSREEAALAASRAKSNELSKQSRRASTAPRGERARVKNVEFVDTKDYAGISVDVAGSEPKLVSASGRRAVLEISDAELPKSLERTLDTSRFDGPVRSVSTYRAPGNASTVRIVVDLDEAADSSLVRSDKGYQLRFAKRDNSSNRKASKRPPPRTTDMPSPVVGGYGASSTPITQKTVAQLSRGKKVYRGPQIDLDFKDADIHNLLRLLADVGGVNIVVPDEIRAKVTVRMRRVPWDQALEVILASKGLWYRRDGNLYRVAPRKQLDAEDQAEAERVQSLVQAEAPEPEIFTLNYVVAKDLQAQLQPLLSPKGRIEVDARTNSLIVSDIKAHRRRIIDLASRLDTQTPQIQIEARIVEARSTFIREFGIQWGGSALASAAGGNATGLIFPNSVGVRGGADDSQANTNGVSASPSDFAVNMPAAVGAGSGGALGVSLGSVGGNFNLNLRLSALEDSGSVRIISAPKITVLNNIAAEISQGVSIPISVVSANGVQTQFVPADLSLKVVPHVSQRDCSIAMEIQVTKNEADFVNTGSRGDPTILRKEAKTTILVNDGDTSVMGGIYTRNTGLSNSKVPFFGDIPVLGWFFKNRRENDERTEVLVFITPKITNKGFLRCE